MGKQSTGKSTLRLRIISLNLASPGLTTDEVVAHLRSHFREYSRLPKNSFASNVEHILTSLRRQHDCGDEFGETNSVANKEKAVPSPSFADLGGMNGTLTVLATMVLAPLCRPRLLEDAGLGSMDGILLYGPPGCGKTMLACAIANEAGVPFYKLSSTELVSGVAGDSEEKIRDLFKQAHRTAPSIIFIDEIDAVASKRENTQREMEKRITAQLITCMDAHHSNNNNELEEGSNSEPMPVLVIGATNKPNEIDPALRRPGRFGQEFTLGVPDENLRFEILSVLIRKYKIECTVDLTKIARSTPGFVGADLNALVKKANYLAYARVASTKATKHLEENIRRWWRQPWSEKELSSFCVSMSDFEDAITMVQISSKREGFSSIPSTKWDDIGGLESLRKELEDNIVQRIKNPEGYKEVGLGKADGILLFGPPGCGKTSIAEAVASEAGANFIHIMGPELLNKYVGESERAIRTLFTRARTCAPCILFFDEVDALARRNQDAGQAHKGVASQLLIELQGGNNNQGVYVIGATNRPEEMDDAFLRPGRFGQIYYVGLPNADERSLILKAHARGRPIAADVDLDAIARSDDCSNLSGADLYYSLMERAAKAALKESRNTGSPLVIQKSHFEASSKTIVPSVKKEARHDYEQLAKRILNKEDIYITTGKASLVLGLGIFSPSWFASVFWQVLRLIFGIFCFLLALFLFCIFL